MAVRIEIWGDHQQNTRLYSPGVAPGGIVVFSGDQGVLKLFNGSPFAGGPDIDIPITLGAFPDSPPTNYFFHVARNAGGEVRNLLLRIENDGIDKLGFLLTSEGGTAAVRTQQWAPPGPLTISFEKPATSPPIGLSPAGRSWIEVRDRNDVVICPKREIEAGVTPVPCVLDENQVLSVHLTSSDGVQSGGTEVVDIIAEPVR